MHVYLYRLNRLDEYVIRVGNRGVIIVDCCFGFLNGSPMTLN